MAPDPGLSQHMVETDGLTRDLSTVIYEASEVWARGRAMQVNTGRGKTEWKAFLEKVTLEP